jgi:ornithine carbamoyltransferase
VEHNELAGRDFISTADWSVDELGAALDAARELKRAFEEGRPHRLLPDKTLFMIFLDLSTRTRNAFEAGMTQPNVFAHARHCARERRLPQTFISEAVHARQEC